MKKRYITLLLILISLITVFAADLNFSASVDRTAVSLDTTFTFILTVSGSNVNNVTQPRLPDLSNFSVLSSSQSSSYSWVNGKSSGSKSFKYILRPVTAGTFTIGAAVMEFQGQAYKTAPVSIKVTGSTGSGGQHPGSMPGAQQVPAVTNAPQSNIFTRITLSKTKPYVNEQVILTYSLYRRVQIWQITQSPDIQAKGFWKEDLPDTGSKIYQNINGVQYLVESFKVSLFPMAAGIYTIPPVTMKYVSDFWDRQQKAVESLPLKVTVLPFPQKGKPPEFNQAVGQFDLKAAVDKDQVEGDETVTFKVQIDGAGNIKTVKPPLLPDLGAFRRFDSGISESVDKSGSIVRGKKIYTYVLVPEKSGKHIIGPVRFSYFDPSVGVYKIVESRPITVTAKNIPKSSTLRQPVNIIEGFQGQQQNVWLLLIKKYENKVYICGMGLFVLLLGVLVIIRYRNRLRTDTRLYRLKRATGFAQKKLKSAAKLLKEQQKEMFYAAIYKAVSDYIGDKFNVEAVGMTRDQLLELLSAKNASDEIQSQVTGIFDICDFARFAPSKVHIDEMRRTYDDARELIIRLEREIK
ncbi:MAG: BatD family protein [Candidatus Margulisiibacteriota bacterium]